jgi:penicillin-binding protein 2
MGELLVSRPDVGEFRRRYKWMALGAFLAFCAVCVRLFQLQVVSGADYAAIAHENIVKRVSVATTRGVIRDAFGKILASSRPAYNVYVIPGRAMPSARPKRRNDVESEPDSFGKIAETLRLNPDERTQLEAKMRAACEYDDDHSPCWRPILVREDLPRDIVAEVKQHQAELAGADIVGSPVRYYPYKNLGAHLLGYVAEIDADTLAKFRPAEDPLPGAPELSAEDRQKLNPLGYEPGDSLGATGVERSWESQLRGQRGWEKRIVDARGRYRTGPEADRLLDGPQSGGSPRRQDPIAGRDLRLTIDIELEQAIDKIMRAHAAGAVVVTEARTGRLLALYSKPDFDPNDLSGGAGKARVREQFGKMYEDPLRPMLDKTMSGAFQPGSTFKAFSALAALENKVVDPDDHERCDGYVIFGRRIFHCTHVHGRVNMHEAIAESCNSYFFKLAMQPGMLDDISRIAGQFGLGEKTGLGVNPETAGRIPNRAWYALRYKGQFRIGFTLNTAIGEGDTLVTPLQLALAYAAIGNGGQLWTPELVRAVETSDGSVVQEFPPRLKRRAEVSPANLARVQDGLYGVVNDPEPHMGTAYPVRDPALEISGKTGTAQTGYVAKEGTSAKMAWYNAQNHAWFASYYPAKNPEISVVVLVEHGGAGPKVAAPLAVEVIREYARLQAVRAGKPEPKNSKPIPENPKPGNHP